MSNIGGKFMSGTTQTIKQDFKLIGNDWRINWIDKKFWILHGHNVGTPEEHWDMAVLEKGDKKGIHFFCRIEECNVKVPGGVVAAALTRKLSEALES